VVPLHPDRRRGGRPLTPRPAGSPSRPTLYPSAAVSDHYAQFRRPRDSFRFGYPLTISDTFPPDTDPADAEGRRVSALAQIGAILQDRANRLDAQYDAAWETAYPYANRAIDAAFHSVVRIKGAIRENAYTAARECVALEALADRCRLAI